jgi:hypothetical protein
MAKIKLANNLFLGKEELNHMIDSLGDSGYKEFVKHMIQSYGVARTFEDSAFDSFKVIDGTSGGNLSIQAGYAFDQNLNIIHNPALAEDVFTLPSDSTTRWIILTNEAGYVEEGTVDIDASGALIGSGTLFSEVLRGGNDFPSKISFPDSASNTGEYNLSTVTSDTAAQLNVAAGSMTAETGLKYRIVGTFTPGVIPSSSDKNPFERNYFSATLESSNTSDGLTTFALASVSYDGVSLAIADLRSGNQFSSGGESAGSLSLTNPLVGIEQITYNHEKSDFGDNLVKVGWGFKSTSGNWSFNPVASQITITAGSGGVWDDKSSFTNNDFNGWIAYSKEDGQALAISTSQFSGADILLDVEFTSSIPTSSTIIVVPNAEHIEFSLETTATPNSNRTVSYPIHEGEAQIPARGGLLHKIYYRHISGTRSTGLSLVNDGDYHPEANFDETGTYNSGTQIAHVAATGFTTTLNSLNHEDNKASKTLDNNMSGVNNFQGGLRMSSELALNHIGFSVSGIFNDSTIADGQSHIRLNATGNLSYSGFTPGTLIDRLLVISSYQTSARDILLRNESSSSSASNRMTLPYGRDLNIPPGEFVVLFRDNSADRWKFYGASFEPGYIEWSNNTIFAGEVALTAGSGSVSFSSGIISYRVHQDIAHVNIEINVNTTSGNVEKVVYTMPSSISSFIQVSSVNGIGWSIGATRIASASNDIAESKAELNQITIECNQAGSGTAGLSNNAKFEASFTYAID